MSTIASPRESIEQGNKLRAVEKENRSLKEELAERAVLLEKTKAAIEELQLKLQEQRDVEDELRSEAQRVIDEQAQTTAALEQEVHELESQLHEVRSQLREANLAVKHGSNSAQQQSQEARLQAENLHNTIRERDMRVAALEAELEASRDAIQTLEASAKEQRSSLQSAQASAASEGDLRRQAEEGSRRALEEKQVLASQIEALRAEVATLQRKAEESAQQRGAEVASLQAELASKQKEIIGLMDQRAASDQSWQVKLDGARAEQQALEQRLANASKGQSYDWEAHEREWTRRLQEVELHWEKRLRDGMISCERKFEEAAGDADARVRLVEAHWQANLAEVEAQWAARLSDHQRAIDMHRAQVEGQQAALLAESQQAAMQAEVEAGLRAKLDEFELRMVEQSREANAALATERAAADRLWAGRLESAQARWAHDMAAAAEQVAEAKAQAQADAAHGTELVQQAASSRLAAAEAAHQRALEAAHANWQQEREALHLAWQQRQAEAEQTYKSMQGQLQSKVAAITARLTAISQREGTLDSSRREMTKQLEDLQSTYEAELQRRAESEAAARNAAQVCRSQLEGLREQVESLQHQLREAGQLPSSLGKRSLLETALAPPQAIASPTWPASPNGNQLEGERGHPYTIAPPSTAHHSTHRAQPMLGDLSVPPTDRRDTLRTSDQNHTATEKQPRAPGGPPSAYYGSSSHKHAPGDAEVMAALQELRAASISPHRSSAPHSTAQGSTHHQLGSTAAATAAGSSPGGYSGVTQGGHSPGYSNAAATQGGGSSPRPPLSPLPPYPTPLTHHHHHNNHGSSQPSNLSLAQLAQHPPSILGTGRTTHHAHDPNPQSFTDRLRQPAFSELSLSQQSQAPPRGANSPPSASLVPPSELHDLLRPPSRKPAPHSGHSSAPPPPQSLHTSSELEAIQQQLAAMRSTVAASTAAHSSKHAPIPPPSTSHVLHPERGQQARHAADHSAGLLSPAAAKHLEKYREQISGPSDPSHRVPESVPAPAANSAAAEFDRLSAARAAGRTHHPNDHAHHSSRSAAPSLGGFESVLGGTRDTHRGAGVGGVSNGNFSHGHTQLNGLGSELGGISRGGLSGGLSAGDPLAHRGLSGLSVLGGGGASAAPSARSVGSMASASDVSVGGVSLSQTTGGLLSQQHRHQHRGGLGAPSRPRSVVRSLEPTLSGAASQAGSVGLG